MTRKRFRCHAVEFSGGKSMIKTEVVEVCPHCEFENVFGNWDVRKQGYVATCQSCGEEIFLCDECLHSEDNPHGRCNWTEASAEDLIITGRCFRGATIAIHKPN